MNSRKTVEEPRSQLLNEANQNCQSKQIRNDSVNLKHTLDKIDSFKLYGKKKKLSGADKKIKLKKSNHLKNNTSKKLFSKNGSPGVFSVTEPHSG